MKMLIRDNINSSRDIDVEFEPREIVGITVKAAKQKLINNLGLKDTIAYLANFGASKELEVYLLDCSYLIEDAWDLCYYTSKYLKQDEDAMLFITLKQVEKDQNVDLVELLKKVDLKEV